MANHPGGREGGADLQKICDTQISEPDRGRTHWETLRHNYAKAPFFDLYRPLLEPLYASREPQLSAVNLAFIRAICGILGIATKISWSMDYRPPERGQDGAPGGTCASEPRARTTYPGRWHRATWAELFDAAGIALEYFDYAGYPEYPQRWQVRASA